MATEGELAALACACAPSQPQSFGGSQTLIPLSLLFGVMCPKIAWVRPKKRNFSTFSPFSPLFGPKEAPFFPSFRFLPTLFSSKLRFFEPPNGLSHHEKGVGKIDTKSAGWLWRMFPGPPSPERGYQERNDGTRYKQMGRQYLKPEKSKMAQEPNLQEF